MSEVVESKEIGRFTYVEPTNIDLKLKDNAITFPYEDYNFGVKLSVSIPDRFSCGKDGKEIFFSSDNGTISFFGGTGGGKDEKTGVNKQGYLTTSFTDISAQNVDRGNKECLGIEHINISYQQWFYPIVNIRFVDVRGASLFMPQEKAMQQTIKSGNEDITQIDGGSFFKAIFACPSPIFKLTVMGFYGKSVTYNLKMSAFQTEFDSENGNFIANVDFIGNMYGIYTEVPMQYLAIAPYMNWEYWQNNVNGKFSLHSSFSGDTKMLTFPEFWKKVETMEKDAEKHLQELRKGDNYTRLVEKNNTLKVFRERFNDVFRQWYAYEKNGNTFEWINRNNDDNGVNSSLYKNFKLEVENFVKTNGQAYSSLLSNFPEIKGKYTIINGIFYKYQDNNILYNHLKNNNVSPEEAKNNLLDTSKIAFNIVEKKDTYEIATDVDESIFGKFREQGSNWYIFEINAKFIEIVDEFIKSSNEELDKEDKQLKGLLVQKLNELLGFDLSIGNIFKMVYAHLDTFIDRYYKTLNNINSQLIGPERSLQKFGISHEKTDIAEKIKNVPPYPLIVDKAKDNTSKDEVIWPGDMGLKLEEMLLVDEMLAGGHNYLSAFTAAENDIRALSNSSTEKGVLDSDVTMLIPVTMYDIIQNNQNYNPYSSLIDENNPNKTAEQIKTVFALRVLYAIYMYGYGQGESCNLSSNTITYIAWAEALNLRKAIGPKISKEIESALAFGNSNIDSVVSKFISYLKGATDTSYTPYWKTLSSNSNIISDSGDKYDLIKNNDDLLLPVKYNVDEIKSDIETGNINTSSEYINLTSPSKNKNTLRIYKNNNVINELKNNVSAVARNYKLPTKVDNVEKFFETFTPSTITMINPNFSVYQVNIDNVGNAEFKKNISLNSLYNIDFDTNHYVAIKKNNNKPKGKVNLYNSVTYGTVNKEETHHGVFTSNFYKQQTSDEAQAYCFLFSIASRGPHFDTSFGRISKISVLLEGAYLWRKEETTDPINCTIWNKDMGNSREKIPMKKVDGGDGYYFFETDGISENDKCAEWSNFKVTGGSFTNKEVAIGKFKEFAKSREFKELKEYLEKYHEDIDKSPNTVIEYQRKFLKMMFETITMIDYGRNVFSNANIPKKFYTYSLTEIYKQFLNNLNSIYGEDGANYGTSDASDDITANQLEVKTGIVNDKHLKISTYLILKDLYDKYFSNMAKDLFTIDTKNSEFNKFLFIDSYYNDISSKLMVNSSFITDLIKSISYNTSEAFNTPDRNKKGMSIYEFISEVCQNCGMTLLALPQTLSTKSQKEMRDMFTPFQYKDLDVDPNDGCYVALYSYKPSQHLDILGNEQYAYKNDSFDINGSVPSALSTIETGKNGNFTSIPAFGVSYAKQNQSLFKKISLSTSNSQVTEQSIFATMDVAAKGNEGPRESTLYGQDLYRVFSNYSYQCTVEMMGNAQIMPLMYFQLNNIPMWHGAYMIISVEHSLSPGDMTTRFTGVRVNRNAVPLVDCDIVFRDSEGNIREWSDDGRVSSGNGGYTNDSPSIAGQGEVGTDYSSTAVYDYNTNNYTPAIYNTTAQHDDEKLNATWAVRSRFGASKQEKGYCAKWTYNLAKSFINKVRNYYEPVESGISGGWGAAASGNHEAIRKLGYTLVVEKHNISGKEIIDLIGNKLKSTYKYGDVMFYWSNIDDYGNLSKEDVNIYGKIANPYGYNLPHHAQFYVGDAWCEGAEDYDVDVIKSNPRKVDYGTKQDGWITSTLNNYDSTFVYNSIAKGISGKQLDKFGPHTKNTWHVLLYRATRLVDQKDLDTKFGPDGKPIEDMTYNIRKNLTA